MWVEGGRCKRMCERRERDKLRVCFVVLCDVTFCCKTMDAWWGQVIMIIIAVRTAMRDESNGLLYSDGGSKGMN